MDTTKIEGYENMTAEEKIAALEAYEFDTSGLVPKASLDKATTDAAEWKVKGLLMKGDPTNDENGIMFRRTKTETINKPADYPLGIVASETPDAYPDNAEKGAYWYIKRE